jgi:Protein of unknown function (DUF3579)
MHAALQHDRGTIRASLSHPENKRHLATAPCQLVPVRSPLPPHPDPMSVTKPREFFIQGITLEGRTFRPSDWAERLAGAMSCFRPGGGAGGIGAFIGYSPYCVPRVINGVKCVIVNEKLRDLEPMAWDFVMNFAKDNHLQVSEACLLPDPPAA